MSNHDTQLPEADRNSAREDHDDYAPREHSLGEHVRHGLIIATVAGLFFGLLWLFER